MQAQRYMIHDWLNRIMYSDGRYCNFVVLNQYRNEFQKK
ncbi:MAG: hypothetical protein K0S53_2515 [Bacteroidetes bacterium]|jgi:hypothetical protein|nr:hypothetical protein [Bacteroidota bacterium]MDF2453875.1 hypothetical protein [Bacteroidota bacterium]